MVEIRDLRSEEEKLVDTINTVFSYDPAIVKCDYFRKHVMNEEGYRPSNVKVVVDSDGRILSHVVIQPREVYVPGGTIMVGGVALVGTLPEHRNKGYATELLNLAIDYMKAEGYDASFLFTNNPFFENTPWKLLKREFIVSGLKKDARLNAEIFNFNDLLRNVTKVLQKHYHSFSKDKRFLLKRSGSYWENRLSSDRIFPKDDFWFFFDPNFVGYAVYEIRDSLVEIKEAVWLDDNSLDDIVVKASQIAENNGLEEIGMFGPWLRKYDVSRVIDQRGGKLYKEDLMMLPLKEGIELPKEPVLFWPTDHF